MSSMSGLRIAAWGATIASYVCLAVAALDVGGSRGWVPLWFVPFIALAFLAPATVGLLIATRQPRNPIAWIMLLGSLVLTLPVITLEFLVSEGWQLQVDRAAWPLFYAWPIAVTFVFPNGRLLSPRWRWVVGAAVAVYVAFITFALLDPEPFYGDDASVPNPMAGNRVGEWLGQTGIWVPLWLGILASLIAGAVAIRLRLRRSTGIERLQTMWLAWSAVMIPVGLLFCGVTSWIFGDSLLDWILFPFLLLIQAAVAVAVGVA